MLHLRDRRLWAWLLLGALASAAWAETIELLDGTRIETPQVTIKDGKLVLADGREIDRNDVRKIIIAGAKEGEQERAPLMGGADVQDLLTKAKAAREKYTDVGAINLIESGDFTLRPDGTQVRREHRVTLILKEPFKSLGQISQYYEDGRDRVTLVKARTIAPDGQVYEFNSADLKESKPAGGMLFYNQYKTVTGQLPQVETGTIVETIWEVETYNPYDKELFFPRWYFGGTEPTLQSDVTVRVPKDKPMFFETKGLAAGQEQPAKRTEGDYDVYAVELKDVSHIIEEPAMPSAGEVLPSLAASPFKNWDYIFDFLGKFQSEHTKVTPEIEAKVKEIVGDATDKEEQLKRLYHWMQREIRYVSIKGSLGSGWSGHPATLTLQNKYGDCIDKATLFSTMCKAVGIEAQPVILATYGLPEDDRKLPTMYGNHAITEVQLNGRDFHLDCTGTSYRYPSFSMMDQGVSTINVLQRKIGQIEVPPPDAHAIHLDAKLRLEDNGDLKAIMNFSMSGEMEGSARAVLEQVNEMFRKMLADQMVNSLSPGAEVKKLTVSDQSDLNTPLTVEARILFPDYPTRAGELLICKLPLSGLLQMAAAVSALDERKFDILLPSTMSLTQTISLELPTGYVPKGLPEGVLYETPYTQYNAAFEVSDGKIVFKDTLALTQRRIPATDYAKFKDFMEQFTDFAKRPLFLYKTGS